MKAAVYVRKSTKEDGKVEGDKSCDRQIEDAREYAARKGWTVLDEHIYRDDAVSGGEWENRHGWNDLLAALKPKPPFDVLIAWNQRRVGRDAIRVPLAILTVEAAGVKIFSHQSDNPTTMDTDSGEMLVHVEALVDMLQKKNVSKDTRSAHQNKAGKGQVVGGRLFGYDNVREDPTNLKSPVRRVVNPEQAAIVVRIF